MMKTLVTGANRGIGLELVRQLKARGDDVIACARSRSKELDALGVPVQLVDVRDAKSVGALTVTGPLDIVFNVAGVYGGSKQSIKQMADDLELRDVLETFDVNAVGPLRIAVALRPHLRAGSKLVHVTSGMGSITDNTSGGFYAYRMSKAALNMASRSLAVDLKGDGIISVVINPGWVQTDMGGGGAPTPVDESVRGILREVDRATLADSGEFLNWKGNRYAF
jgi:NAD(P)-dependent dehydrogenase (short-subunit alcohol dehydrogenase family)